MLLERLSVCLVCSAVEDAETFLHEMGKPFHRAFKIIILLRKHGLCLNKK